MTRGATVFHLLAEGYARRTPGGGWVASPACVLLRDAGVDVLVDPGANAPALLAALAALGMAPADVDMVFLTHTHLDHILNLRLFPGAPVCDGVDVARGDVLEPCGGVVPGTGIRVVPTPGHSPEHFSLVADTPDGRVVVAGDAFWWMDGEAPTPTPEGLMGCTDDKAHDPEQLRASRRALLALGPRWIVPGHGAVVEL